MLSWVSTLWRHKHSRLVGVGAGLLAATVTAAVPAAAHKHKPPPDLVVAKVSNPPASLASGFMASTEVENIGGRPAAATTTRFYLSSDKKPSRSDVLAGAVNVAALGAGKHQTVRTRVVAPKGTKPGTYFLIACADATHKVTEKSEVNNCRPSQAPGKLACTAGDTDCDGWLPPADCDDNNPAIHPGAPDTPDLNLVDSNCDGVDGDVQHAIFVSPVGDDGAPGTPAQPKRTLAGAVAAAAAQQKDVYATLGTYSEALNVANGVGVYGGYDTSWKRALANVTRIAGDTASSPVGITEAAVAQDVTAPTSLQLLTLSPSTPTLPGRASFGLRGINSAGLRLQRVTIQAGAGKAGAAGKNGVTARNGQDGKSGLNEGGGRGGAGGAGDVVGHIHTGGPDGHPGGDGGRGGNETKGGDGAQGQLLFPDSWGFEGGLGGPGGAGNSTHKSGGKGYTADSGHFGANGAGGTSANVGSGQAFWESTPGGRGLDGSAGHGGGGGGGGGSESCTLCTTNHGGGGGGGGGGGEGGNGGEGGQGGGGSFGIFLVGSAGAIVQDSTVTASDGGAGGAGGGGTWGGLGGAGAGGTLGFSDPSGSASAGGDGGLGGVGGRGGDGGGGAGGPSVAIFGLTAAATPGTTVSHGTGGAGGAGGNGSGFGARGGVAGAAADYVCC